MFFFAIYFENILIIFIFIKSKNEVAEIRGVFKKLGGLGENGALLSYLALFQGKCGALSLRNIGNPGQNSVSSSTSQSVERCRDLQTFFFLKFPRWSQIMHWTRPFIYQNKRVYRRRNTNMYLNIKFIVRKNQIMFVFYTPFSY